MYPKTVIQKTIKNKKEAINLQFKDALQSIMASLKVGLSINSAIIKVPEDLEKMIIGKKDKTVLNEFIKMRNDMEMGVSLDDALKSFSESMQNEDIEDFVNSIMIVRQKGGNMVDVMENVTNIITDKIEIKKEIEILTTGKKMEAKIISLLPIGIILILSVMSPSYMKPLYESILGKIAMVFGFILLSINYFIGKKIVDIKV